jgi:DNA-binding MarR family transcriptional regulator
LAEEIVTKKKVTPVEMAGVTAMVAVIDETRSLFHRMKRAAEETHRDGALTAGKRGVLKSLEHHGPQTVPELARARPVSRQHIQLLVNPLIEEGLVEQVDNPRHRRSKLIRLTPQGLHRVEAIDAKEAEILKRLADQLDVDELWRASETLRKMRLVFEEESRRNSLG